MSEASSDRKFEVFVVADSDRHTSAELASMLQMSPDEAWEKDATFTYRGRERHRKFSRWAVVERDGDIEDWRVTVERLIGRIRPIEAAFRSLPPSVYVGLVLFVTEDNGVFGCGLEKHQVEFMASIGAELDMSFVVSSRGSSGT